MKITILTIFPHFFESPLKASLLSRAIEAGNLEVELVDIRNFSTDKHRSVDDAPFGGGAGMVMMVDPVRRALQSIIGDGLRGRSSVILTSAAGRKFDQKAAIRYSLLDNLVIVCGRYKGLDERIHDFYEIEEVSIGDYVINGGETAALAIMEATFRLLPGGIGKIDSALSDSFIDDLLGPSVYTRPAEYEGAAVPAVLIEGDHRRQQQFRRWSSLVRTRERRPDLLRQAELSDDDRSMLQYIAAGHEFEDCY
jgi:tRNA (guanine37-N1)-methyltransferase